MGRFHHLSLAVRAVSRQVEIGSSADPVCSQDPDQGRQAWIPTGTMSQRVFTSSKSRCGAQSLAVLCTPGERDGRAVLPTWGGFHDKLGWEAERRDSR